jgi:hypothetical protein
MDRLEAASVLQATGFRGDGTRFRLKASLDPDLASKLRFAGTARQA